MVFSFLRGRGAVGIRIIESDLVNSISVVEEVRSREEYLAFFAFVIIVDRN